VALPGRHQAKCGGKQGVGGRNHAISEAVKHHGNLRKSHRTRHPYPLKTAKSLRQYPRHSSF
jgi:hypothetical protein